MNGKEEVNNEFECSTKKDYVEFLSGGKTRSVNYNKECNESIDASIAWLLSNKELSLVESDTDKEVYTIKSLTESTMVLHLEKSIEDGKEQLIDFDEDGKADDLTIYLKKL